MRDCKLMVMLEKVRSTYNVGSVFRVCDAAGVEKLFLCGYCAIPPNEKLGKTALGSTESVEWEHHCEAVSLVRWLKKTGVKIVVVESDVKEKSIFEAEFTEDTCLVFGHEEAGVSPELRAIADEFVTIPQFGKKDSLNVSVAAGITIYEYKRKLLESK